MLRTFAFAAAASLTLAACGGGDDTAATKPIENAPMAAVPAPAGTEWRSTMSQTEYDGYLVGNPNAPLKLVEYGSLTCPTCARFGMEGMEPLLTKYVNSGVVSFELRNFAVHGTVDIVLARLARCGQMEAVVPLSEQIWQNYEAIMTPVQAAGPQLDAAMSLPMEQRFVAFAQAANFYEFFAERGISEDQGRACLADVPAMEKLANDTQQQGEKFNVTGTPTFFLNGQKLDDVNSWGTLEPVLQRAGAR